MVLCHAVLVFLGQGCRVRDVGFRVLGWFRLQICRLWFSRHSGMRSHSSLQQNFQQNMSHEIEASRHWETVTAKSYSSEPELELAGPQKNEQGVNMYCRLTRQDFKLRLPVIPFCCAHVACGRVYKVSFGIRHRLPEGPPLASKPRNPNNCGFQT